MPHGNGNDIRTDQPFAPQATMCTLLPKSSLIYVLTIIQCYAAGVKGKRTDQQDRDMPPGAALLLTIQHCLPPIEHW